MRNKSKQDIIDHRRRHVAELRLNGLTIREIVEELPKRGVVRDENVSWALGTIAGDMKALEKHWRDAALRDIIELKGITNARLEVIIRAAFNIKDHKTVLAALQQQRELFGLDAPIKTQIAGIPGGEPIPIRPASIMEGVDLTKLTNEELNAFEIVTQIRERHIADHSNRAETTKH